MLNNVIEVKNLKTYFSSKSGLIKAVDGVSFDVPQGKTFAIVGESGSGKSVTALSIMRLIPKSIDNITEGEVLFGNIDLLNISEREMCNVRGKEISIIFQEPMTSLNPVMRIGDQIKEVAMIHNGLKKSQAKEKAIDMLNKLGITSIDTVIDKYPHQMSGGMKQRIMIAMALICTPRLLIADEPTTSLDVTIQALIIDIIKGLQIELNMSIIFISHDLNVVAEVADYVSVMFGGKIVECTDVKTFFRDARHPYSTELLKSTSDIGSRKCMSYKSISNKISKFKHLDAYSMPIILERNRGCNFRARCYKRVEKCKIDEPELNDITNGHKVACWNVNNFN